MAKANQLTVEPRTNTGRGGARATRRAGRVPGVIYGGEQAALAISLDAREFDMARGRPGFFATLFDLDLGKEKHRVLCREVQLHPVKDRPIHADFLRVSAATRINVEVPVNFVNEEICPALKKGGVLNVVRHEIELSCRVDAIPSAIVIDLSGHEIGDSIHISEIGLPEGVQPTISDRDFTIATLAAPTVMPVEEEVAEEVAPEDAEAVAEGEAPAEDAPADEDKAAEKS